MRTEKVKSQFLVDNSLFISAGLLKKEEAKLLVRGCESKPMYTEEYASAVVTAVSNLVSKPEIGLTLMNELLLNYDNQDNIYDFVSATKSLIRHLDSEDLFVRDLAVVVCGRAFATTTSSRSPPWRAPCQPSSTLAQSLRASRRPFSRAPA